MQIDGPALPIAGGVSGGVGGQVPLKLEEAFQFMLPH